MTEHPRAPATPPVPEDEAATDPGTRARPAVAPAPGAPDRHGRRGVGPAPTAGTDGHGPLHARPTPAETDDPRLRLSRGVLVSGRYLLTRRLHHDPHHEIWQAVDQTLVRDVRLIVLPATDARAQAVMEAARRAAMVRDQHFLRVFDADRAAVADLTRVWRPGEEDSMRAHPAGAGRAGDRSGRTDGAGDPGGRVESDPPGLAAPLVYVVEEWVPAQPLESLLQRSPLPTRQAVLLTLELAEALTAAHAQGMPHGFVGPDRVLVSSGGSVRISGLRSAAVLASRSPAVPGTRDAREQDAADAAADVRSIGAVLYAALTARWPLGGDVDAPTESLWRWTPGAAAHADADVAAGDRRLRAAPRAHGRVLAPRQVRPGIPRRLDELVLRLLGHAVGDHPPIRTPAQAVELLSAQVQVAADRGASLPELQDLADRRPPVDRVVPAPADRAPARTDDLAPPDLVPPGAPAPLTGTPGRREHVRVAAVAAVAAVSGGARGAVATRPRADDLHPGRVVTDEPGEHEPDSDPDGDGPDSDGPHGDGRGVDERGPERPDGAGGGRSGALAWQGAQSRGGLGNGAGAPGEPIGRVPGDRRAPDLRLSPEIPPPHRLRPILVLAVAVALLAAAAALVIQAKKTLSGQGPEPAPLRTTAGPLRAGASTAAGRGSTTAGAGTGTTAAQVVVPITGAVDFDPVADGGNGQENPAGVDLATDGDPGTAWHTVTYLGRADLGGLKPGVGLVVDLGTDRRVSSVVVGLTGTGTALELRTAAGGTRPDTYQGFAEVASATDAGARVTLTPSGAVRAHWLLIWLTSLPEVGPGQFQGGISTITVRSPRSP